MPIIGHLPAVVAEIYEASVEPDGLNRLAGVVAGALDTPSGFLALLARPAAGDSSTPEIVGLPSATENFDDSARAAYADHYHKCNIWFEQGVRAGFPAIVLGQELVPERQLLRSEWYEYCRRLDAFHVLGAQFHINGQLSAQFGAHRPYRARPFDEDSRRTMQGLLPHLQRALQINLRLGFAERAGAFTLELLERVGFGALILDAAHRLLFANSQADRALAEARALRVSGGRVAAVGDAAGAFARMVDEAIRTGSGEAAGAGGFLAVPVAHGRPMRLLVSPLPPDRFGLGTAAPAALVLISGADRPARVPPEQLCAALGLTRAEGKLLSAMLEGDSVGDYAAHERISVATARTHLKRLLSKTGHHRQVDLVREVASDPIFRFGR